MSVSIRVNDELYSLAKTQAKAEFRTIPSKSNIGRESVVQQWTIQTCQLKWLRNYSLPSMKKVSHLNFQINENQAKTCIQKGL